MSVSNSFVQSLGKTSSHDELKLSQSCDFYSFIKNCRFPIYAVFVEIRISQEQDVRYESIILEVEPEEIPQRPKHDIRRKELLAFRFSDNEERLPEVLALRIDFQKLPHTNLVPKEHPVSLCLYDAQEVFDVQLNWTPKEHLERTRYWLTATAFGRLHHPDQPLEPLLANSGCYFIIPRSELPENSGSIVPIEFIGIQSSINHPRVFLPAKPHMKGNRCSAVYIKGKPVIHGIIDYVPTNVEELSQFLSKLDLDLIDILKSTLSHFIGNPESDPNAHFSIILDLPKLRYVSQTEENYETWAFMFFIPITKILVDIDLYGQIGNDAPQPLIGAEANLEKMRDLHLVPLRVLNQITPELAAIYNNEKPVDLKILGIGIGAIGSQAINNLFRSGFGRWTLIDNDLLLPHNLAKHYLDGYCLGHEKARVMSELINSSMGDGFSSHLSENVLHPQHFKDELKQVIDEADLILDFTASISVGKHLAIDIETKAKTITSFLNPSGDQLVIMGEDSHKSINSDLLEVTLYQAILTNPILADHLLSDIESFRYGNSCRDISSRVPQDHFAIFAGIASKRIKTLATESEATIEIYRILDDLTINKETLHIPKWEVHQSEAWKIYYSDELIESLSKARKEKLPNETGGVLIGHVDRKRKICYISGMLKSPKDSTEWPTSYLRGCDGISAELKKVNELTLGNLTYLGEWHSHPDSCSTSPSNADLEALSWLREHMKDESMPAIMVIIGENSECTFLKYES